MRVLIFCLSLLVPLCAAAQAPRPSDAVLDAVGIVPLFDMLQAEAVESGRELGQAMLPDGDVSGWTDTVRRLNAPERLMPPFRDGFAEALPADQISDILAYLTSSLGQRIMDLELSARAALNAPGIEEAVLERFAQSAAQGDPRVRAVESYIEVNDLVEANVLGALAANAAFLSELRAAADGGGARSGLLADVWAQEPEIRAATEDWITAFVSLAYGPLDDAEMQAHIEFARSPAGQALNAALFEAFDTVYERVSGETGAALGRVLNSSEL